jgi:hypothetical protein
LFNKDSSGDKSKCSFIIDLEIKSKRAGHSPVKLMHAKTARDASQGLIQVNFQLDKNFPKMSEFASIPEHEDVNQTGSDDF